MRNALSLVLVVAVCGAGCDRGPTEPEAPALAVPPIDLDGSAVDQREIPCEVLIRSIYGSDAPLAGQTLVVTVARPPAGERVELGRFTTDDRGRFRLPWTTLWREVEKRSPLTISIRAESTDRDHYLFPWIRLSTRDGGHVLSVQPMTPARPDEGGAEWVIYDLRRGVSGVQGLGAGETIFEPRPFTRVLLTIYLREEAERYMAEDPMGLDK